MQHFVNNVERYIVNQIIHISWREFQDDLQNNVSPSNAYFYLFVFSDFIIMIAVAMISIHLFESHLSSIWKSQVKVFPLVMTNIVSKIRLNRNATKEEGKEHGEREERRLVKWMQLRVDKSKWIYLQHKRNQQIALFTMRKLLPLLHVTQEFKRSVQ